MQAEVVFSLRQIIKAHFLLAGGIGAYSLYHWALDYYIYFKRNENKADYARLRRNKAGILQMRENQKIVHMGQNEAQIKEIERLSWITLLRDIYIKEYAEGDVLEGCAGSC